MQFSIIIPTCNRNDLLSKCLDCLEHDVQQLDKTVYEVIVTDDSKTNGAKQLIEQNYPWVKWVEGPKKGPAANRNNGAKYAKGKWLVFTDDDCLPDKNWLLEFSNAIDEHRVYEGLTDADRPKERFDEEAPINLTGGNLWSCNFMIERSLFTELRGFDEAFPYPAMEDTDLFVRINKVASIKFVHEAKIIHPWRRVEPFKNYKRRLASHIFFAKKYGIYKKWSYRYSRIKIFISNIFQWTKELAQYSFKGIGFYFESILLNFLIIFS